MQPALLPGFHAHWADLAAHLNIDRRHADAASDYLLAQYSGADRHYHNVRHIVSMLDGFVPLQSQCNDPAAAALAIFFHDAVYDPARRDNEARSAEVMAAMLAESGLSARRLDTAAGIIHATQAHARGPDRDTNLVLDLDMAILGQPWPVYLRFARGVMREYLAVYDEQAYRLGRVSAFLDPTIARGEIFLTADFQSLTPQAIENMRRERTLLQSGARLA